MKVNILALDGVFDTGLATVQDVFSTANELAGMLALDVARFDVSVVAMRTKVHTFQGLRVPVIPISEGGAADWIVVPAIGDKMPDALQTALQRRDVADAAQVLREHAGHGGKIAAACIGTFVLAESGLLDEQKATTTWWLASLFRQRYPAVRLDESRMVVSSGAFVTAGAALSHIDMALLLVRQASPELSALVAKYLIVDSRPSQSAYVITDHLSHADPTVERFERWARGRLADGFSLDEAASAAGTSKRTLARRMHRILGKSPLSYFQDLRVERAVHMLKTSEKSLEQIAELVGYADGVTLRSLLRQRIGRSVRELRANN
ncbi:helix-turn-helix domain-containing protein [Variovorax sp. J22P240]|uniref:GlxA family transcriptional regulator n=1 Tax=Variovorax sp. J22P240 TaxID=3053514 RepID=UPI002576C4EF|nr:helix-turn-helix domain-containing protein [Variovorax sp. J22P240]MDL9997159.1 helix-turn-helix domain-containing protein [Variovorax sp. J22P240]